MAAPPIMKSVGLQGPIDDAFMAPFIVVTPSGHTPYAPEVDKWVEYELAHFLRCVPCLQICVPCVIFTLAW